MLRQKSVQGLGTLAPDLLVNPPPIAQIAQLTTVNLLLTPAGAQAWVNLPPGAARGGGLTAHP
jgi:hypothetical protein